MNKQAASDAPALRSTRPRATALVARREGRDLRLLNDLPAVGVVLDAQLDHEALLPEHRILDAHDLQELGRGRVETESARVFARARARERESRSPA